MTTIAIDVEEWARLLGPSVIVAAYYALENEHRMEEWEALLHPDATSTHGVGGTPSTARLADRIDSTLEYMTDMQSIVKWITNVSDRVAVAEIEARGTYADGRSFRAEVLGKYEFDEDLKVRHITVYPLHPDAVAEVIAAARPVAKP